VDQYLNNRQNEVLWELLANPADNGQLHNYDLQQLVDEYPQSGILRAMLAHSGNGSDLKHAATYFNPRLLHKIINNPESLALVSAEQVVAQKNNARPDYLQGTATPENENYFNIGNAADAGSAENKNEQVSEFEGPAEDYKDEPEARYHDYIETELTHPITEEPEIAISDIAVEDGISPSVIAIEDAPVAEPEIPASENKEDIEDEIFDEIVGIENIVFAGHPAETKTEEPVENKATGSEAKKNNSDINFGTEKWIIGSIAATDYFMFDNSIADQKDNEKPTANDVAPAVIDMPAPIAPDAETVSKYHDEKMPYTFMWWLDKTRKEYASTYQPYITPAPQTPQPAITVEERQDQAADELQQQYFENIFHDKSLLDLENAPVPDAPEIKRKEDIIIEKFIKEEPQIRPPAINKLDNENKAKKSSEDKNELVSETLAQIYSDQMLYHKAITTYKKLMLKFPEKSRYFAHQIEQLEKKTN
jgi:hypothetical protein